jgi:hypothetical protein
MEEILKLITNYGFPIVVAIYLLTRYEQKMATLTEAIKDLALVITECRFVNRLKDDAKQNAN